MIARTAVNTLTAAPPALEEELTVTRPSLPPFEEYEALLRGVWQRNYLTNAGPLVVEQYVLTNPALNYAQFLLRAILPTVLHIVIAISAGYAVGSEFGARSVREWLATVATAQADFTRDVTKAYAGAAREFVS